MSSTTSATNRRSCPRSQPHQLRHPLSFSDEGERSAIDLITRDENIRWLFSADIGNTQVDTLAAVLAESMTIPDVEREALQRRSHAVIGASSKGEITGTTPTKPTGSEATTGIAESASSPI